MLRSRVLTALLLLPVVLGCVFVLPTPWFAAALGIVVLLGAWEWAPLVGLSRPLSRWAFLVLVLVLLSVIGAAGMGSGVLAPAVLIAGSVWWLASLIPLVRFNRTGGPASPPGPFGGACVGLLLLVPGWVGLVWLHARPAGAWLILVLFVLTWAADVGAYFAGRALGRCKLAPRISPGKTWEGVAGGLLLAVITAYGMLVLFPLLPMNPLLPINPLLFGLLAGVTVIFSVVGDLFESMIKRRAGVKDSGTLLPGHGGILDRIDSLTATATLFAAGLFYWL